MSELAPQVATSPSWHGFAAQTLSSGVSMPLCLEVGQAANLAIELRQQPAK